MSEAVVSSDNVWRKGALAGVIAGVINVVIWTVGNAAGLDLVVEVGGDKQHVTMTQPFLASFFGTMIATLLAVDVDEGPPGGALEADHPDAGRDILISPLTAATDIASGITLALMHVVVLAMLVLRVRPRTCARANRQQK